MIALEPISGHGQWVRALWHIPSALMRSLARLLAKDPESTGNRHQYSQPSLVPGAAPV